MEEPFHEDAVLYRDLRAWLQSEVLPVLIADGEGDASSHVLQWAREGVIDVVQYDIFGHGFTGWLATGKQLDEWGARTAPHHYGGHVGNYIAPHLAGAIRGFTFVEWDHVTTPGIDAPGYVVRDGWVEVADTSGFGITLDEATFHHAVETGGYDLSGMGGGGL